MTGQRKNFRPFRTQWSHPDGNAEGTKYVVRNHSVELVMLKDGNWELRESLWDDPLKHTNIIARGRITGNAEMFGRFTTYIPKRRA